MTNYGTIPTSTSPNLEYISRAKARIKSSLATRRPWKQMFNFHSFNFPSGFSDFLARLKTNTSYFRMNYVIIMLLILFLSLLWHPVSLIVFVVMMALWLFLYFLRDEPLVIVGKVIDDRIVIVVLGVLTIVLLLLTKVTEEVVVSLCVGVVVVVLHAALRKTEDLYVDDDEESAAASLTAASSS